MEEQVQKLEGRLDEQVKTIKEDFNAQEEELKNEVDEKFQQQNKKKLGEPARGGAIKAEGISRPANVIPPQFDGKVSWGTYLRQFEAAATAKGIPIEQQQSFEHLKRHLEMRYGDRYMQHHFEADILRLVRLAYPTAPSEFLEQLSIPHFIDGLRDSETQQSLRLGRHRTLNDALSHALELEAAKVASRGHMKVRRVSAVDEAPGQDDVWEQLTEFIGKLRAASKSERGSTEPTASAPGKLSLANSTGRQLDVSSHHAPPEEIKLSRFQDPDSLTVDGTIFGSNFKMIVDTGSARIIVRPHVVGAWRIKNPSRQYVIVTASGQRLPVKGTLRIKDEEIVLSTPIQADTVGILAKEDVVLPPPQTETLVASRIDSDPCDGMVGVVEPSNPGLFSTELGVCEPVTIVRRLEELQGDYMKPDANVLPDCLQDILSRAKTRLNKEQTKQLEELLRENKEVFALKSSHCGRTNVVKHRIDTGSWAQWDSLAVEDGALVRNWENSEETEVKKQVLLPRSRVHEVLQEVHGGIGGGHLGTNKTPQKLRNRFYWANCRTDVEDWYRKCDTCAASIGPKKRSQGNMRQYNVGAPMFVNDHQDNSDKLIPPFLLAYRFAVHETPGKTPARIVFGKELRLPADLLFGHPTERHTDPDTYVGELE
ncbi:hypothetical protein NQ318_013497 [Aromia moschata]|uniref:RNA-directed DNA polymerase n=1 Tax=Aromia moschata TaxID=1265417 RepID=A0AAV8YB40_9CUCU|nr:hypothetical protein NQ318_013497 [Aromia moschata]